MDAAYLNHIIELMPGNVKGSGNFNAVQLAIADLRSKCFYLLGVVEQEYSSFPQGHQFRAVCHLGQSIRSWFGYGIGWVYRQLGGVVLGMKSIFFAIIYLVFFIQSGLARETTTIICIYPTFSDKDGNQPVSREFKLTFILDHETATAYMLGNLGSVKVQFMPAKGGMSFREVTASGNLMTTTIDQTGNSVHSRNSIIGGKLVPSQYYGKCTVK